MRYFISLPCTKIALPLGIGQTTFTAGLIFLTGATQRLLTHRLSAVNAVNIAAIAATTDHRLTMAVGTVVEASIISHRQKRPM